MDFDILLNPKKYGYTVCRQCNGYGSSLRESAPRCTKCGGSGLVKQQKEKKHEKQH